jgi:hypothetical protein
MKRKARYDKEIIEERLTENESSGRWKELDAM